MSASSRPVYPPLVSGILLAGALGAAASRWPSIAAAALISGALAVATVMLIDAPGAAGLSHDPGRRARMARARRRRHRRIRAEGGGDRARRRARRLLQRRTRSPRPRRAAPATSPPPGAGAPLLILVVVYLRHVPFETRPAIGIAALVMAAVFAGMTERLIARRPADLAAPAPAFYASGAVLALAFAIAVGLSARLHPAGAGARRGRRRLGGALRGRSRCCPGSPRCSPALACVALFRHTPLTPDEIGTTPILNGLILRFGAARRRRALRRRDAAAARATAFPPRILQAIGLALAALFVVLEIRHVANGGVIVAGPPGLGEQSALTLAALAFSLGLQRIAGATRSEVYRAASLIAGVARRRADRARAFRHREPALHRRERRRQACS